MILETTEGDYAALVRGEAPRALLWLDPPIAPPAVVAMLADVAAGVRAHFAPASWLIVHDGELVGLCSITRPPTNGEVDLGYGIAPGRQGRGHMQAALRAIAAWADSRPDVAALTAETATANLASQRVLERAGFVPAGERIDDEDGPLIRWRYAATKSSPSTCDGEVAAP
jgi:RimJ/RimL family protein N-acetyltransferase